MRILKVYRHGLTMGTAPEKNDHKRVKRGEVGGWSESSTRRNTAFLRSVDEKSLPYDEDGRPLDAFAGTFTLKNCPANSDDWHSLRNKFHRRLLRQGLVRSHWVTEWQRRGVPHLHGAFWFPKDALPKELLAHIWCMCAVEYVASMQAQHMTHINDAVGWFKYLSKHASRGVSHYQRSPEGIPEGWKKTGRMWGKTGDWPVHEPIAFELDDVAFFRFRRVVRNWRIADARQSIADARREHRENPYDYDPAKLRMSVPRLISSRKMLQSNDHKQSAVRGVSEWVSQDIQLLILDHLRSQGSEISC